MESIVSPVDNEKKIEDGDVKKAPKKTSAIIASGSGLENFISTSDHGCMVSHHKATEVEIL